MHSPTVIEIGSPLWWRGLCITTLIVAALIVTGRRISTSKEIIRKISGILLIALAVLLHVYLVYLGTWNLKTSLPLQLCSISGILSGVVLLWRNQFAYELLLYWGIPG